MFAASMPPFRTFLTILLLCSCRQEKDFRLLDLNPYGIPFSIFVPDTARVVRKEYDFINDITVQSSGGFDIQIFESDTTTSDLSILKYELLGMLLDDPSFIEVITEETNGFIFQRHLPDQDIDYDFRMIRIVGAKQYVFQTGLMGSHSLEEVELMFKAMDEKSIIHSPGSGKHESTF